MCIYVVKSKHMKPHQTVLNGGKTPIVVTHHDMTQSCQAATVISLCCPQYHNYHNMGTELKQVQLPYQVANCFWMTIIQ